MKTTERKPAAGNNDWLGNTTIEAQLQIINEQTNKWETLGTCSDTPNALKRELEASKYQGQSIWIRTPFGRRYHGQIN